MSIMFRDTVKRVSQKRGIRKVRDQSSTPLQQPFWIHAFSEPIIGILTLAQYTKVIYELKNKKLLAKNYINDC